MIKAVLETQIKEAISALGLPEVAFSLEHPIELSHGDYATNVAMVLGKFTPSEAGKTGSNSRELANSLTERLLAKKHQYVEKVEVAGPGFINFFLSPQFFADSIGEILTAGEHFGSSQIGAGKKVLVEYSSPNIAKPFTVGHLRSTIIGDAMANILSASGYAVIRDNHLGDWGTQFGKLIVALERWGSLSQAENHLQPIKYLVDLYVKFHDEAEKDPRLEDEARQWFAKLEQGDAEAKAIWQQCVALSLAEFDRLYQRLGVSFDTTLGESFFNDKMSTVVTDLRGKGLLKESEGAQLVFFPGDKLPPLMILKQDGSSLYSLRDLAADKWRVVNYGNDILIINEVGSEQSLYFKQLFAVEEMLGYFSQGQRVHVAHGLYRFQDGKMSTRRGNVIWLEEILDEAVKRAAEFNPEVAETVAIGALKYNDLKRESIKDIVFDWEEVLNLKGNSGPYLQYAHTRAVSILDKAKEKGIKGEPGVAERSAVERMVYRYPEVVARAAQEYAPHHICTYLFELAAAFSAYYAENQVVSDQPESAHRVALTAAVGIVLKNGLALLGIAAPDKM